jgi:hypothetical protein
VQKIQLGPRSQEAGGLGMKCVPHAMSVVATARAESRCAASFFSLPAAHLSVLRAAHRTFPDGSSTQACEARSVTSGRVGIH